MRNPNRIKPFMRWLTNYWEANPDLRFGQMLVNLGIISDGIGNWTAELEDYNLPHEVIRECLSWGNYLGTSWCKELSYPLPYYKQILIKDLETNHIKNILKTQKHIKGTKIESILKEELKWRKKKEK